MIYLTYAWVFTRLITNVKVLGNVFKCQELRILKPLNKILSYNTNDKKIISKTDRITSLKLRTIVTNVTTSKLAIIQSSI